MPCVNIAHIAAVRWLAKQAKLEAASSTKTPRENLFAGIQSKLSTLHSSDTVQLTPVIPDNSVPALGPLRTRSDLINAESRIGATIFGPIPSGHRREFFHDRNNIWIWHEDWFDRSLREHQLTVRYEVRQAGVYKKVAAGRYYRLEDAELENFRRAIHVYLYRIKTDLYHIPVPGNVI